MGLCKIGIQVFELYAGTLFLAVAHRSLWAMEVGIEACRKAVALQPDTMLHRDGVKTLS